MAVQFTLKELMAKKERQTGEPCTYEVIRDATGISLNTLSLIATNKIKRLPVDALDKLLVFFNCEPNQFIVHIR
jgi:DNA-binding Xre family transcriptional regulator